jgi:hypothetical protein
MYRLPGAVSIVFTEKIQEKFFYFSAIFLLTNSCLAFRMRKGARAKARIELGQDRPGLKNPRAAQ